ncbi:MAG: LacI family DNA-binding transcriptional regulator [Actinomycetota bacterium]
MPKVVKIEDVAERAGVSVATVSRALRGLPHVSPATRDKVRRIAAELDYRPNPHASRLAAGRSGTIGIVLPVLDLWYYGHVLAGVEAEVSRDGLDIHLVTVNGPRAMQRFVSELPALSKRVDSLIIVDLFLPDQLWEDMAGGELPIATIGLDTGLFDSVFIDNQKAAAEAVTHLLDLGHRRIGFIGGEMGDSFELHSATRRREGMNQALAAHDLLPSPGLEAGGGLSVSGGREAMAEMLGQPQPPTAVLCASDELAIGALWAASEAGVAVPGDLSVVGFDDQPVAEAVGLTTVHQPVGIMAARAAAMVVDRLDEPERHPTHIEMPTTLEIRRTTDFRHLTQASGGSYCP